MRRWRDDWEDGHSPHAAIFFLQCEIWFKSSAINNSFMKPYHATSQLPLRVWIEKESLPEWMAQDLADWWIKGVKCICIYNIFSEGLPVHASPSSSSSLTALYPAAEMICLDSSFFRFLGLEFTFFIKRFGSKKPNIAILCLTTRRAGSRLKLGSLHSHQIASVLSHAHYLWIRT